MANDLLSFAGWYFLPSLVTGYLQSLLYTLTTRAGDAKPSPRSPRYVRDRQRIHIAVILAYLAYTIYDSAYQLRLEGNFYSAMGVPFDVDEKAIQSRFRRLTVQHHPDKYAGPASELPVVEAIYVQLQLARDTLLNPAKRFAYDRFGPTVLQWRHCKITKDFVLHGVQQTALYYVASGVGLVLMSMLGYLQQGKFWRYVAMGVLGAVEMSAVMSPTWPVWLEWGVNPFVRMWGGEGYLPFQALTLLRKLGITFFIALGQLGPLLQGPQVVTAEGDAATAQQLDRLDVLAKAADQEVSRLMGLELSPFLGDGERNRFKELRERVKDWLVQNTVRNDPEVKAAVSRVLDRRRQGGSPEVQRPR
ncbi:uncharacterized protein LTR77_004182 [Saxophila tyrrhenica]|uniref:J domain-containing protein n=1 Tax=Saxophila tyrrhenica TaxID=1690608 RepID=A0AAV9PG18_9PEZI|nr:hypothetical protein LTR77_004182 [Saxophila tyrrhenica]